MIGVPTVNADIVGGQQQMKLYYLSRHMKSLTGELISLMFIVFQSLSILTLNIWIFNHLIVP
jgi:hypothetical protein